MNRILSYWLVISLATTMAAFAKEPENIILTKQKLVQYHDSGQYDKDIQQVLHQAKRYLSSRLNQANFAGKKPAIVLDIDETSLSNYTDIVKFDFGGTVDIIQKAEDEGNDQAIPETLQLYQFAKAHDVAVFFLTGRKEEERVVTSGNLKKTGYANWDKLILRDGEYKNKPAAIYKTAMRKEITQQGYDIVFSIGDQQSDLVGGYADKTYKLPNPYYFIP